MNFRLLGISIPSPSELPDPPSESLPELLSEPLPEPEELPDPAPDEGLSEPAESSTDAAAASFRALLERARLSFVCIFIAFKKSMRVIQAKKKRDSEPAHSMDKEPLRMGLQ